ncbi:2-acylglycerol O-acyltransferase 2-like [Anastrepha obliqua]|uniref:2-acylglycerol O-acyltransferase 2-like n=1 Tax=Anastrepha obliqua TaxID=95512 RepID=UPI0024090C53|nr:2-acylglycerol O-acyltransferase 2-like [Anastrepha obliqua]
MALLKQFLLIFLIHFYFFLFYFSPYFIYWYTAKGLLYGSLMVKTLLIAYLIYLLASYTIYHNTFDGNGSLFLRSKRFVGITRDYFPVEIRKTAELPPNRNYVLAHFPHGILAIALSINLLLEITPFLRLFPGIRPKVATLNVNFATPFLRELLRVLGYVSSSKPSLLYYLNKSNNPAHRDNSDGFTSNLIGISVGGVQESMQTKPGQHVIILKKRLGFVKLAIQTGSSIVPSFGFGDVDLYTPIEKAWFRPIQIVYKKIFRYSPLLFKGRGNTILPYKKKVTLVVGSPIDVKRTTNPDPAYVEEIHAKVVEAVHELFETYKSEYIENGDEAQLVIT